MDFKLDEHTVWRVNAGSHLYGTATEDSDIDVRAVVVPPREYFLGLHTFENHVTSSPVDSVFYDIRKFFRLALKGNPSVLEILWAAPQPGFCPEFKEFVETIRPILIAKSIVSAHIGMANAHLSRLEQTGRNCGVKGKLAIEKYGYNTKDAAHVIRVLRQCRELLTTRNLRFPRLEAEHLREIKAGKVTLNSVRNEAELLITDIRRLEADSEIQQEPCFEIVSKAVCSYMAYTQRRWA